MIQIRKAEDRGHAQHGWLDTYHTFSFAGYFDPRFTGFRDLLVINEDRVEPGKGFGSHAHDNMEIITYIVAGELIHKDSMGMRSLLQAGGVQRASAGSGIIHSEFNNSETTLLHLLQIWIKPKEEDIDPSYEQKEFPPKVKRNNLKLIVSPDGQQGSVSCFQNIKLYASLLDQNQELKYELPLGHAAWVQVVNGSIAVNGSILKEGDGAAIEN